MSLDKLLTTCAKSGVILSWDGCKVKAYGDSHIISELLPALKARKEELQAFFMAEARQYYEERAAIAEYEGSLPRSNAEAQARAETHILYKCNIH